MRHFKDAFLSILVSLFAVDLVTRLGLEFGNIDFQVRSADLAQLQCSDFSRCFRRFHILRYVHKLADSLTVEKLRTLNARTQLGISKSAPNFTRNVAVELPFPEECYVKYV